MLGHASAAMALDSYADLFPDDLDAVAERLDAAVRSQSVLRDEVDALPMITDSASDLRKRGGAAGNRTPDLFDANEARYQLRYSPMAYGSLREPSEG